MGKAQLLPFNGLKDLHIKCSNILKTLDDYNKSQSAYFKDNGIDFVEIEPFGKLVNGNTDYFNNVSNDRWDEFISKFIKDFEVIDESGTLII